MRVKVCMLCVSICLLSGCWDARELTARAFVTAAGFDKRAETSAPFGATLSAEDFSAREKKDNAEDVVSGKGAGAAAAFNEAGGALAGAAYLGQAKAILLGRALLADADMLRAVVDTLERDGAVNGGALIIAAADASEALKPREDGKPISAFLTDYYQNGRKTAPQLDLEDLAAALRAGGCAVLPWLAEDGERKLDAAVLLKDGALAAQLNARQTRGYLWLTAGGSGMTLSADEPAALTATRVNRRLRVTEEGGRLVCTMDLRVRADIRAGTAEDCAAAVTRETRAAFAACQAAGADALRLQENLRKFAPWLYQRYAPDWEAAYAAMSFAPRVTVTAANPARTSQ